MLHPSGEPYRCQNDAQPFEGFQEYTEGIDGFEIGESEDAGLAESCEGLLSILCRGEE